MMRLSKTVDYMVRCALFLAQRAPGAIVDRRTIVEATGIPDLFFRKIVQQLGRAGTVRITRGPKGQYALAVPAEELTLLQVVEIGGGEICLNECALRPEVCGRSRTCPVHPVWQDLRGKVRDTLAAVTFAALARSASGGATTDQGNRRRGGNRVPGRQRGKRGTPSTA